MVKWVYILEGLTSGSQRQRLLLFLCYRESAACHAINRIVRLYYGEIWIVCGLGVFVQREEGARLSNLFRVRREQMRGAPTSNATRNTPTPSCSFGCSTIAHDIRACLEYDQSRSKFHMSQASPRKP